MNILMKVAASKTALWAIIIAWPALVSTAFWFKPNNFIGTIVLGADWIVKLVMLGSAESQPLVHGALLFLFPLILIMIPAAIIMNARKSRSARHANS